MTFRVILKSGAEFTIKAAELELTRTTATNQLTGYKFTDITENKPCYLDINDVSAIIRKLSDEEESEGEENE
jgi:hypothetical protein